MTYSATASGVRRFMFSARGENDTMGVMSGDPLQNFDQTNPSLLRSIRDRGNREAWGEFDALYRPMLGRFAKAYGLRDSDVDDVVQHCMTALCLKIDEFQYDPTRGRFKSWLRTMVNNRCRDVLRSRGRPPVELDAADGIAAAGVSPEDAFERIWLDEHLGHGVRMIEKETDAATFAAFRAYVIDGRSVDDVCREMALTPNQLYKIKHRLTRRLKDIMAAWTGDDAPPHSE